MEQLQGSEWDAVVDFSTSVPAQLEAGIQTLGQVGRYIYVSSVSPTRISRGPGALRLGP